MFTVNGVKISFHPAGHVVGSAQIRLEYKGEVWVITGDYKTEVDGITETFELIPCDHFVTETTFALPIYHWEKQEQVFDQIHDWWQGNASRNEISLIHAYSLGKAQRLIANLDRSIGPIHCSSIIEEMNETIRGEGFDLPATKEIRSGTSYEQLKGAIVISSSDVFRSVTGKRVPVNIATASGWNQTQQLRNSGIGERFTLSDHCDWDSLMSVINETNAENLYLMHGFTDPFSKYLRTRGFNVKIW